MSAMIELPNYGFRVYDPQGDLIAWTAFRTDAQKLVDSRRGRYIEEAK